MDPSRQLSVTFPTVVFSPSQGKFYDLYGKDYPAGAMIAWAWAVSRIIDVMEADEGMQFNVSRIGVTACSRNG